MRTDKRRRRRLWMLLVYPLMWLFTFIGIDRSEPQLFGIPLWYLWAGFVVLLLVPVNAYFVRYCWPEERDA
jgi:hypothetical protein